MAEPLQKIKQLFGSTPQGFSGRLVRESQLQWRYETADPACALSLAMPVRHGSYASNTVHPIFAMNLPEGEQFHRIRTRFAKQFSKLDEMAILSIVGHDQIGRVSLTPTQGEHRPKRATVGLAELKTAHASEGLFETLFDQFYDAGISGAQPKVLIPDADVPAPAGRATARVPDLIIKTGGAEYPCLSQNEYTCMLAAKKAGLDVPEFHLSNDGSLFMMRRFDLGARGADGEPLRLGFEDFAVLTNATYDTTGDYKYRGHYEGIAALTGHLCQTDDQRQQARFFEYLVFCVMVRNGDAHLKNFGLLYADPAHPASVRLSPLYDVVTTTVYDYEDRRTGRMRVDRELALKLNKSRSYPTREELMAFGQGHCGVRRPAQVIDRIAQSMTETLRECKSLFPAAYGERFAAEWGSGLLAIGV